MNTSKTLITFVLDESGSMAGYRDAVISGFNEFLGTQKDKSLGECRVTLVKFNSLRITTVFADKHIDDVPDLKDGDYSPNGMTPLYDAISTAIKETEGRFKVEKEVLEKLLGQASDAATPLVTLIVFTDGEENVSKFTSRQKLLKLIEEKKAEGWTTVFIGEGSDPDTWKQGQVIGMANNTQYSAKQTGAAFSGLARAMTSSRVAYNAAYSGYTSASTNDSLSKEESKIRMDSAAAEIRKLRTDFFGDKVSGI